MSLYNKASLIQVPSLYKDGLLVSTVPEDRSGDFTFTRGSNLSATRVGPNGYIEKGYENLLYPSNDFSGWSKVELDITPNQADPFGGNTATLITTTGTTFGWIRQQPATTGVQTISFYAKEGSNDVITAYTISSPYPLARFTLTGDGSISSNSADIDSTITSIGNGWYRCSMAYNVTSSYEIRFAPNNGTNVIGDSVYIYGFQLNQGLVAYPYIETTTAPVAGGILEDEPRIDFSDGCGHLLLEPSRTNLIPYSEYIQGLGLTDLTPTPNATTSPEGFQNAYKVLTGTAGSEQISYQVTGTSGNAKTQSVYIKADSGVQWIRLIQIRNGFSNSASTHFDIQNGVKGAKEENGTTSVVDDATKIEDAGNGWYRLTLVCTDSTNNTIFDTRVRTAIADGSGTRVSNGSYFVWGLQMEQDATYPTSYIPTYGVSQTRLADDMDLPSLSSVFDSTGSWTMFFELQRMIDDSINYYDILRFNGTQGDLYFRDRSTSLQVLVINGTQGTSTTLTGTINKGDTYKIAVKWDGTTMKAFFNGGEITFNNPSSGTYGFNNINVNRSHIKHQELYFPTALSNSECIALTSL